MHAIVGFFPKLRSRALKVMYEVGGLSEMRGSPRCPVRGDELGAAEAPRRPKTLHI